MKAFAQFVKNMDPIKTLIVAGAAVIVTWALMWLIAPLP